MNAKVIKPNPMSQSPRNLIQRVTSHKTRIYYSSASFRAHTLYAYEPLTLIYLVHDLEPICFMPMVLTPKTHHN